MYRRVDSEDWKQGTLLDIIEHGSERKAEGSPGIRAGQEVPVMR